MYALLMITNKHEAVSYRFPTFSLLLEPHGGLVHMHLYNACFNIVFMSTHTFLEVYSYHK